MYEKKTVKSSTNESGMNSTGGHFLRNAPLKQVYKMFFEEEDDSVSVESPQAGCSTVEGP